MSVYVDLAFLDRVLRIRYGSQTGTAIYVEIAGRKMLITAAHIVAGLTANERIAIRYNSDWVHVDVLAVSRCALGSDVCAILPKADWGEALDADQLSGGVAMGQDVVYCGFPLDWEMAQGPASLWPLALVKRAILSGGIQNPLGNTELLFDTINNKGFSGGPIVKKEKGKVYVVAIVSGYKHDRKLNLYKKTETGEYEEVPDYFILPNSGFMIGTPIGLAVKAAKQMIADLA